MSKKLTSLHPLHAKAEAFRHFLQHNPYVGSHLFSLRNPSRSLEFTRDYLSSDPIKFIDWKIFSRTDKLVIREQHSQAPAKVIIYCDINDTMDWPDGESSTKKEIAMRIAHNLSFFHKQMNDDVHLLFISQRKIINHVCFLKLADILDSFFSLVEKKNKVEKCLKQNKNISLADRIYFISDFINPFVDLLPDGPKKIFFHILNSRELDIDWVQKSEVLFDHKPIKEFSVKDLFQENYYFEKLKNWLFGTQEKLKKNGSYFFLNEQTDIKSYLLFLAHLKAGKV